jgi:N-methylhydantoinase A
MSPKVLAIDVGGTFIDLVSVDQVTSEVSIEKQPATPDRLAEEIVAGLGRLPGPVTDVAAFFHGSTVAINALVQRRGARVGLITTRGFRDVLELGRGNRPSIYDWVWVPPEPLVPRGLRREVGERLGPGGEEIAPLDLDELARQADALVSEGVEAIAICFLHAYANPKHEREAADAIAIRQPHLALTLSSEVAAEWHEYERTSTAVINAYLSPVFAAYLTSLREHLTDAGMTKPVGVMQSNGGSMTIERAAQLPVRTLASGPAGGVIGASMLARRLGHTDVICADVGGTTFDVAVIEDGRVQERTETDVDGLPVLAPTVDVVSIGAGGGSIAWFDDTGALRVGPLSAGARPGPACFGFGGDEPTVTDCQLVLGRLDSERFLGSRMKLDSAAAERAVHERIASRLGMSTREAALGVLTIAENAMANAIHSMTVERGLDPRDFFLYAYGGGGGLFAAVTAGELGIGSVVTPRGPANFSAWGISASAHREDASTTRARRLDADAMEAALVELGSLHEEVIRRLEGLRSAGHEIRIESRIDVRFQGQEHTVTIEVEPDWGRGDTGALADRFVDRHRQLYGHGDRGAALELVTMRCRGTLPVPEPTWPEWPIRNPTQPRGERGVSFGAEGPVPTSIYDRDRLAVDQQVKGPAVIEEWTSTTLVPPGWAARTDRLGNLVLAALEAAG